MGEWRVAGTIRHLHPAIFVQATQMLTSDSIKIQVDKPHDDDINAKFTRATHDWVEIMTFVSYIAVKNLVQSVRKIFDIFV